MKYTAFVLAVLCVAVSASLLDAPADVITFKASDPSAGDVAGSEMASEFDAQIEEVKKNIKRVEEAIKESEAAAMRLREQKAELRTLVEKQQHLEKQKEKKILETKLEKQMTDLEEINRMSRSLRTKFNDLKRTQGLIKTKITGTRSSIEQLQRDGEVETDDLKDNAENLAAEMDAMHAAQEKILAAEHKGAATQVKNSLDNANKVHKELQTEMKKEDAQA